MNLIFLSLGHYTAALMVVFGSVVGVLATVLVAFRTLVLLGERSEAGDGGGGGGADGDVGDDAEHAVLSVEAGAAGEGGGKRGESRYGTNG